MKRSLNVLLVACLPRNEWNLVFEYLFLAEQELLLFGHSVLAEFRVGGVQEEEICRPDKYGEIRPESLFDFCPDILITTSPQSSKDRTLELSRFAKEKADIPVIWLANHKDKIKPIEELKEFGPTSLILIKDGEEGVIQRIMETIEDLTSEPALT